MSNHAARDGKNSPGAGKRPLEALQQPGVDSFFLDGVNFSNPIFTTWHRKAPVSEACRPVILCPPLFEERKSAHRSIYEFAETIATPETPVIRLDYPGTGESPGTWGEAELQGFIAAVAGTVVFAAEICGVHNVVLGGVRAGALIAAAVATRPELWSDSHPPAALLLIAPVSAGKTYVHRLKQRSNIRRSISTGQPAGGRRQGAGEDGESVAAPEPGNGNLLDLDGFPVPPGFLDELAELSMEDDAEKWEQPVLLIQCGPHRGLTAETKQLQNKFGPSAVAVALRLPPFWERIERPDIAGILEALADNRDAWSPGD